MSQTPVAVPKVNASATRSLMFGLWSLLCGPFTGLHAVVIGFRSLREITQSKGVQQGTGFAITGIAIGMFTSSASLVGVGTFLIWAVPTIQKYDAVTNDYKQIGMALHLHHDKHREFPIVDDSNKVRQDLSWRAVILPYLGEADLYHMFDYKRGWESPWNRSLAAHRPEAFTPRFSGFAEDATNYLAVVNADSSDDAKLGIQSTSEWDRWVSIVRVTDGASNTIMVVVADKTTQQGPWTMGYDLPVDLKNPAVGLQELNGHYLVLFVDGSSRAISKYIEPEVLADLMNRADGRVRQLP